MLNRKAEVFAPTDGVIRLCTDSPEREERGADFTDPALLIPACSLAFRRMRISSRDVELADSTGCEITAKLEVRHSPLVNANNDVEMSGKPYEVTRIESRGRTCWLWLSEIAYDGTCELLSETYEYDEIGVPRQTGEQSTEVFVRKVEHGLKRTSANAVDALDGSIVVRIRACDYASERRLRRSGVTYTVLGAQNHGRWVDLTCKERGADRG